MLTRASAGTSLYVAITRQCNQHLLIANNDREAALSAEFESIEQAHDGCRRSVQVAQNPPFSRRRVRRLRVVATVG
jgi:hypothetical protein